MTSKSSSSFSKVAYPPIVDAKPTDMTTLSCFIACIGKLWSDGGLSDFLVESGIYASCTVELMLSGKQFNRAVHALMLLL